ncbi:hypothetical protein IAR55_004161 [Kwoniella newhampshirensis]|uniref:Deacetylase sirtuin-type domain-containing protein n=1 Tax=Kwoniella newhampshirensis TaxID=1651941 RepID=A0AAW0YLM3_9TREE
MIVLRCLQKADMLPLRLERFGVTASTAESKSPKPHQGSSSRSDQVDSDRASGSAGPIESSISASRDREEGSDAEEASDEEEEEEESGPLQRVASLIKSGKAKNVIFLLGAGISTSAGIPDFRSPSTGLYHNLQKLNLPFPEAVFELGFFKERPEPFWALAKEIYPGKHIPTPTHYLLPLFDTHKILRRVFTQNIDTLETLAGLPRDRLVEAHGSFATSHCLNCRREVDRDEVLRAGVRNGQVVRCDAKRKGRVCGGLVKPDVVFFGENLPERFFRLIPDLRACDLLIVIGTSLQVRPFSSLVDQVPRTCPRLLINREPVGPFEDVPYGTFPTAEARDLYWEGDADEGVWKLVHELGWREELEDMIEAGKEQIERKERELTGGFVGSGSDDHSGAAKKVEKAFEAVKQEVGEQDEGAELEEAIRKQLTL